MRKILLGLAVIVFASSAAADLYGVKEVGFETDLPSEHDAGEGLEITGFAEGHNLDELRIYRETSGIDEILEDTHCGGARSCDIDIEESFGEGEETFYIWARARSSTGSTVTDSSERQTVNFIEGRDDVRSRIDGVEIDPSSDRTIETGEWQEIQGFAEGRGLESIEIWKREEGESWERDKEESCDEEDECSVSKQFRYVEEQSVDFEVVANIEGDSEASDSINVVWEDEDIVDRDGSLDVTVRDDRGERLRDARVTVLDLGASDYAVKSVDENIYSERADPSRTGDRELGFELDGRNLKTYVNYYSGYSEAEWNNLALESSSGDELVYRYELDASDRRQSYRKYSSEQETRISSGEKDLTVRLILNGEEVDSFTAEIDAPDDHEFVQIRESGRTVTEGRDTTVLTTTPDLASYTQYTDRDGKAYFELPEGRYRVTGWKSGYSSDYRNLNLDAGESRNIDLTLDRDRYKDPGDPGDPKEPKKGDITLESVSMDSSVCKGDETTAHIAFKNQGEKDRAFRLAVSGLSSSFDRAYVVKGGETRTVTYTFSNIQGSGNEKVRFNTGYDSTERTVQVRECPSQEEVSDVKFRLNPSEVRIGQSVQVSGYVDTRRRQQVDIKIDGATRTSTHTEPDGFFRANIRPDAVGDRTVEVKSGDKSRTANLRVLPTVSVNSVRAPDRAFEGERFEICGDVESQTTPLVVLKEDGEIIESKNARGDVCFERRTSPGQRDYEIQAFNQGATDSKQRRVEVFESDVETRSFPDQIASVRSGSGMVKVEMYNTRDELRRYELELVGLPRDWVSQSRKEVVLDTGERKTEYIYITPKEEGVFETTLNVRSDGETIYTENVDVRSGGTSEREPIWVRLRRWWRYR